MLKEIKADNSYKGTRILLGNEKRTMINSMVNVLVEAGFEEISIPVIQMQSTFQGKVGEENNNQMFNFKDRGDRDICLAPEYTAVVQSLSKTYFKPFKDIKVFYIQECFRGEKPQAGRYRQFTQFGVEIINPNKIQLEYCIEIAKSLMNQVSSNYSVNTDATRGLDYYKNGKGFEISCEELGAQKQVCGGGEYDGGLGFALGIDRLLLLK